MTYDQQLPGGAAEEGVPQSEGVPQEQVQPGQPQYVTREDLLAAVQELSGQIRGLQSLTMKQENKLRKEIDTKMRDLESMYQELGQPVPEDMREAVTQDVVLSRLGSGNASQPDAPSPEQIQYAVNMRTRLERVYGVQLTPQDPEYQQVQWIADTPDQHIDSYEENLKRKAARVRGQQPVQAQQQVAPQQTPQPGQSVGLRAPNIGNAPASGDKLTQLRARFEAEKAQTKTTGEMIELRARYRREGLDI